MKHALGGVWDIDNCMRSCEDRVSGALYNAAGLGAATIGFETQATLEVFSELQQTYPKAVRQLGF